MAPSSQPLLPSAMPIRSGRLQSGLSLIELMVALVIGLIFSLAILVVQSSLTKQNVAMSDAMQRDSQTRAALDLITRDLSNAGYFQNGPDLGNQCNLLLSYGTGGGNATVSAPATAASEPSPLPTSSTLSAQVDPNLYTPSNGNTSVVLSMTQATATPKVNPAAGGPVNVIFPGQAPTNPPPNGTNLVLNQLPSGVQPGDVGLLRLTNFRFSQKTVCFQIPLSHITSKSSEQDNSVDSLINSSAYPTFSTPFQTKGYTGFNKALQNAGLLPSGQNLQPTDFYGPGTVTLTDLGPPAQQNLQTVSYWVANQANSGAGQYPTLMRAVINAQTGALIGQPVPVAAGVVSLVALFGVGTPTTGITQYLTGPDVLSQNQIGNVRSVWIALVTRSLQHDVNTTYQSPATIPVTLPTPNNGYGHAFDYHVPASATGYHYSVISSEVAVRNSLWSEQ
jgi:type IV pilus assembly protein PilW